MTASLFSGSRIRQTGSLRDGLIVGIAGGLAEVVVVGLYSAATGTSAARVAEGVSQAVRLGNSALTGLAVHMVLAVLLGMAMVAAARLVFGKDASLFQAYGLMLAALSAVWAVNFFVVLPAVSPGFVHLLPYATTFLSKLMFGLAGAFALHGLSRRSTAATGHAIASA